jgi:hypothetical protein
MTFRLDRIRPVVLVMLLGVVGVAIASDAEACPLCFSGLVITPGQKLDSADEAVLAVPSGERGQFRIVEVIKGDVDGGEIIVDPVNSAGSVGPLTSPGTPAASPQELAAASGKPLLLLRNRLAEQWTSLGPIDAAFAPWLRAVAATDRGGEESPAKTWPQASITWSSLSEAEWRDRLVLIAPYLESSEPLAAELAYGELVRAPYAAMRVLKPELDAATIAGWVDDPRLAGRRPAYTLLLGIAGDDGEAAALERRIEAALARGDAADLAAMLAADLELRGPGRVAWIEETFFADHRRTWQEIDAARLALSVHGGADGIVPRQRVVEAYRVFIREHGPMAGIVAQDLTDWHAWEATQDYVDVIRSKVVKDPAGQFAIVNFLRESPDALARTTAETFARTAN